MQTNKVYLAQSDTTVGFLSADDKKLSHIKKRPTTQKILSAVDSFRTLKQKTRIPNKFKNKVRRSKTTTFIYPNGSSYRVVDKTSNHHRFIEKFNALYSTSANETKKSFEFNYAYEKSDIVVFSKEDFFETSGSNIYKINTKSIKKIR